MFSFWAATTEGGDASMFSIAGDDSVFSSARVAVVVSTGASPGSAGFDEAIFKISDRTGTVVLQL